MERCPDCSSFDHQINGRPILVSIEGKFVPLSSVNCHLVFKECLGCTHDDGRQEHREAA
jgi:hypothetical protein